LVGNPPVVELAEDEEALPLEELDAEPADADPLLLDDDTLAEPIDDDEAVADEADVDEEEEEDAPPPASGRLTPPLLPPSSPPPPVHPASAADSATSEHATVLFMALSTSFPGKPPARRARLAQITGVVILISAGSRFPHASRHGNGTASTRLDGAKKL
jgi:hypothetical protein